MQKGNQFRVAWKRDKSQFLVLPSGTGDETEGFVWARKALSYIPSSLTLAMKQEIAAWVYDTACERFVFHFLHILNHKLTKLSSLFKLPQHCPGKAPKMKRLLDERGKMGWLTNVDRFYCTGWKSAWKSFYTNCHDALKRPSAIKRTQERPPSLAGRKTINWNLSVQDTKFL